MYHWRAVFHIVLLSCTIAGCNRSGLDLAHVEGVVTYNGQPVQNAGVLFKPETGPIATGMTDAEGKFALKTANYDGALVGEHRIGISKTQTTAVSIPGARFAQYNVQHVVPEKYTSPATSELTVTVSEDQSKNQFKFELTGKIGGS